MPDTHQPEPTADALVAEARRAVHESLTFLAAPEADRVRALIADLETAVEGRTAIRFAGPDDTDLTEPDIDRMMAAGTPVQIVTAPPAPFAVDPNAPSLEFQCTPAVSVPVPAPTDQTALRDRIRQAVCEAEGFAWDTDMLEPDEYGSVADAVLAVLPANQTTDRAAILRAEAEHLIRDLYPAVYEDAGYKTALGVNRAAMALLDRANAAELQAEVHAVSGPHDTDDTTGQAEPVHVGGGANAEDCPACEGTNPPYPFICPGPPVVVSQPDEEA